MISYIYLIFIILALFAVYFVFVEETTCEGMVALGTDLSFNFDIPGAVYGVGANNGIGVDVSLGYSKVNLGTNTKPIFKMRATIPYGYDISSGDTYTLVPKDQTLKKSIDYYKNATETILNQGPYLDIPDVIYSNTNTGESTPLPTDDIDTNGNPKKYYRLKIRPDGINDKFVMKEIPNPIPQGYQLGKKYDSDLTSDFLVYNTTLYALQSFDSSFNATNTDTTEYRPLDVSGASDNNLGVYYQYDANGNMIRLENTEAEFSPVLYYVPGAYKFGSSNYVPNYEDSVYLSRTTRQMQASPVYNTASMLGGFCNQNKNDTVTIEAKCGALDLNTCASTSCCTLLGGQKCVAGNKNGPTNAANYSDYSLKNKDFYYYQGKCYGNCK
jgi:hypothetical protein